MIRMNPASFLLAVATSLVAAAAASAQTPVAQPGEQSRWSLEFSAQLEQPSSKPIAVHLTGGWTSTVSAARAGEYDAQLQLAHVQFTGDAVKNAPAESVSALQTRLSRPFWATYRNDGALVATHFYADVSPSDRNLLQMIATELQIVRPDSAGMTWTTLERDGAGEYSALYLAPQPDRVLKRKLKYVYSDGVAGAPADSVRISIDKSDITYSLAADHRIQAIDGTDRIRMSLSPDKSQQLAAVTVFHAANLQLSRVPELIGSLETEHSNVIDSPVVTHRPDASQARTEADERLLNGYTTDDLLQAAFAKDSANSAQPDRLTALFRRRPEAAPAAAGLLLKNGPRKIVTNALGAAGSLSSVAALSGLAHNTALPDSLRVDALLAFVQIQHPIAEAMQVPIDLASDSNPAIRSAARLITGALARTGRPAHPAEADVLDAALLKLYQNTHDTAEKTELLGALGNSAGPAAVQTIEAALHDSSVPIRSAAARALRLAAGSEVDALLANVIVNDHDSTVRADAIFATRFRRPLPETLADALLQAASTDQAKFVRSDALAVIRQNPNSSQRIPETLARIAESDSDSGVRNQAKDALASLSPKASPQP